MNNKIDHVVERTPHKRMSKAKILIVVDKFISDKAMKDILEDLEYDVIGICTSSHEALINIKKDKPDFILTDMELNGCDGIYFSPQLAQQTENPKLCIYFTAYATDLIVHRIITIATAMGSYINKYSHKEGNSDFESCFCEYHGIDSTKSLIKQFTVQPPIRVLLVDNQQIVLWGLEKLIDNEKPRMEVVGTATNIADAKRIAIEKQPDILILNNYLDNIDCVNHILDFSNNGNTRVVIYSETNDKEAIDRAILNGARGVVHRKESMQTVLIAIEKIHNGELWLDRMTIDRILQQNLRMSGKISPGTGTEKSTKLTRKECVILRELSDGTGGEQNKQIAFKLCMNEYTLRNHLSSIFSKLGITNRFSLFMYAKQRFQHPGKTNTAG